MPHPFTDLQITFRRAVDAAGMVDSQLRNWLDRDQVTLQAHMDRPERGWRRFSLLDVVRLAIMRRIVEYGFSVEAADAIMVRHFDAAALVLRSVASTLPDLSPDGALEMQFSPYTLILCRDGRSAVMAGLPHETVSIVDSGGVRGRSQGGGPHRGSEWIADEFDKLHDFVVIRMGAIAKDVCVRLEIAAG